jgi:hypothetical protein
LGTDVIMPDKGKVERPYRASSYRLANAAARLLPPVTTTPHGTRAAHLHQLRDTTVLPRDQQLRQVN